MAKATTLSICAALALGGLYGVHLQVEYSGWLIFVGLLAFFCTA